MIAAMKTNRLSHHITRRMRIILPLVALMAILSGCTCSYDPAVYAQLGKSKTDVGKAFGSAASADVQTARTDLTDLVALAEKNTPKCKEVLTQVRNAKTTFDGTDFKRKGSKFYQHKQENVIEAIDLAIKTQEQLKK